MQLAQKLYSNLSTLRYIPESYLKENGYTISLTDGKNFELMIFLGMNDDGSEYEVRIYSLNVYVPNDLDKGILKVEKTNEEYTTFYFKEYTYSLLFIQSLFINHPEFKIRPVRQI